MLHACVQRFNLTRNLKIFWKILGTEQGLITMHRPPHWPCFVREKILDFATVALLFLFNNYCPVIG